MHKEGSYAHLQTCHEYCALKTKNLYANSTQTKSLRPGRGRRRAPFSVSDLSPQRSITVTDSLGFSPNSALATVPSIF